MIKLCEFGVDLRGRDCDENNNGAPSQCCSLNHVGCVSRTIVRMAHPTR